MLGRRGKSAHLILIVLPSMIFHLLDHLELIVMPGPLFLELFLLPAFLFLLLVFDGLLVPEGGELLLYHGVQLFEVDLLVGVDLLVVFGDLQVVVDLYLLGRFGVV
jgi:hypothetical protein